MRFKTGWGALLISLCLLNGQGFALAQKDISPVVGETKALSDSSAAVVKTYTLHHQDAELLIAGPDGTLTLPIMRQLTSVFKSRNITPVPKLLFDKKTFTLMITGSQEAIDIADRIISVLDSTLPQVAVDIQWIELSQSASKALGISDDSQECKTENNSRSSCLRPATGELKTPNGQDVLISTPDPDFNAKLNDLLLKHQASVMTNPRMIIQHSISAMFDSTASFPASPTTVTNISHIISNLDISEKLYITPFIDTEKNRLTIKLMPEITTRGKIIERPDPDACAPSYRRPETILDIPDGESVIISGYQRKRYSETISKLPFLGDLPFLDAVFSSTDKHEEDVEIILILTPHILKTP